MNPAEAWKTVDGVMEYFMSWMWMLVKWAWPVIILCLVLSGVKGVLPLGEWIPNVGAPMYWALTGACYWAVKKAG